jgi:hypothetical protein
VALARAIDLEYRVHASGLHVLSVDVRLDRSAADYNVSLRARSDGLLALFYTLLVEVEATGRQDGDTLRPSRFQTWDHDDDAVRTVDIRYQPSGLLDLNADPPIEMPAPALTLRTIDPVTASLAVLDRLAHTGRCDSDAAVFDGKRRFDMVARDAGAAVLEDSRYSFYAGPAVACRLEIRRIVGFRGGAKGGRVPEEVLVYYAKPVDGGPRLPVRLHARSRFGALRMHLVSIRSADEAPQP